MHRYIKKVLYPNSTILTEPVMEKASSQATVVLFNATNFNRAVSKLFKSEKIN